MPVTSSNDLVKQLLSTSLDSEENSRASEGGQVMMMEEECVTTSFADDYDLIDEASSSSTTRRIPRSSRASSGVMIDGMTKQEKSRQIQVQKELARLQYVNPGPAFGSEPLENKKRRRKAITQFAAGNQKKFVRHDAEGNLVVPDKEPVPLCDCLNAYCPGCFATCKKCGGDRCSYVCQKKRLGYMESTKNSYSPDDVHRNPYI